MWQPVTVSLNGPSGPSTLVFSEASSVQRTQCFKLAWTAFGAPLTSADYEAREEYLSDRPLTRQGGWRIWCLATVDGTDRVVATCKTIHREFLVKDSSGIKEVTGYCIASVVTDPAWRGKGLATVLLASVKDWMDEAGEAEASMLYSAIGDFYEHRGWKMLPDLRATITWAKDSIHTKVERRTLPSTRPLIEKHIPSLCERDISSIKAQFLPLQVTAGQIHVAPLPTANLVTWYHDRASFISQKINGKSPWRQGSICGTEDAWVYWYHDFRDSQLIIQRLHCLGDRDQDREDKDAMIVSLLLDAIEEARIWDLRKVSIFNPGPNLQIAMQLLEDTIELSVIREERIPNCIPSIRWRQGHALRATTVHYNEFFAYS